MSSRNVSVAGTFYPSQCSEIKRYINAFSEQIPSGQSKVKARAIISPHAGYVYSGFTANSAYKMINTQGIKRVIVIGPSHRVYIKGASVALYDDYKSPCGDLLIDKVYSQRLLDSHDSLCFDPSAHAEHSTETQVPFIQNYFEKVELVEIVYGDIDFSKLVPIIETALKDEENFVVISTDLSHFFTLEEANQLDRICLKAIEEMDLAKLEKGCEACGMIGVKAVLQSANKLGLQSQLIDYRTSYDTSSDASSVVGYVSALIV